MIVRIVKGIHRHKRGKIVTRMNRLLVVRLEHCQQEIKVMEWEVEAI